MSASVRGGRPLEQRVVVEFDTIRAFDRFADPASVPGQELDRQLLDYLHQFVTTLALPVEIRLERRRAANELDSGPWVTVRIGEHACRLPLDPPALKDMTPLALARALGWVVVDNREAFVTEPLVEAVLSGVSPRSGTTFASHVVDARLREFVRHGHGVSKFRDVLSGEGGTRDAPPAGGEDAVWAPDLIGLELAVGTTPSTSLERSLDALRRRLFDDLGIILPKIQTRRDEQLAPTELRLRVNDLVLPTAEAVPTEELDEQLDAPDVLVRRVEQLIRERAELFVSTHCVDNLRASSPQLVDATLQRIGMPTLLRVLDGLLEEGLSIRDLRGTCESLLAISGITTVDQDKFIVFFPPTTNLCPVRHDKAIEGLDGEDYLNCARMSMKLSISRQYASPGATRPFASAETLVVYLVDRRIEQRLDRPEPLTEEDRLRLFSAVRGEIGPLLTTRRPPILTTTGARRRLWTLIAREFGRYPVLTYTELSPELNIQPLARISWD